MLSRTLLLFFFLLIAVVQTSILALSSLGLYVELSVVFLVYVTLSDTKHFSPWYALVAGFVLDLFSPFPFGLHLLALVAVVLVTRTLFLNFFTNQSLYAMISLTLAGTLVNALVWFGGASALALLRFSTLTPSWQLLSVWQLLGNLLAGIVVFYIGFIFRSLLGRYFFPRSHAQRTI